MEGLTKQLLEQLDSILQTYKDLKDHAKYDDLSDLGHSTALDLTTRSRAAVERAIGQNSAYSKQVHEILAMPREHDFSKLQRIIGVVQALAHDIHAGYLYPVAELIRGDVFGDFLEMAEHLLNEGYKDAAAVIAGGTLEVHLRKLCIKNGLPIEVTTPKDTQPKRADTMNADLGNASVISKLDQKNVIAWLDLRNKAAHAHYNDYTKEQVSLMIASVRDFLSRIPA